MALTEYQKSFVKAYQSGTRGQKNLESAALKDSVSKVFKDSSMSGADAIRATGAPVSVVGTTSAWSSSTKSQEVKGSGSTQTNVTDTGTGTAPAQKATTEEPTTGSEAPTTPFDATDLFTELRAQVGGLFSDFFTGMNAGLRLGGIPGSKEVEGTLDNPNSKFQQDLGNYMNMYTGGANQGVNQAVLPGVQNQIAKMLGFPYNKRG